MKTSKQLQDEFYASQIEAIQTFYQNISQKSNKPVALTDAIIAWFTNGHAEAYRENYFKNYNNTMQANGSLDVLTM